MIRLDRICVWMFIFTYAMLPFRSFVGFADELSSLVLFLTAIVDCVIFRHWKRYTLLFLVIGIMSFYVVYSLTAVSFNTTGAILKDFVIEIKPYVPFVVMMAIVPNMRPSDKAVIRVLTFILSIYVFIIACGGTSLILLLLEHYSYVSQFATVASLVYLYISKNEKTGKVAPTDVMISLFILSIGLLSTRAKFFGYFVLALFMMFVYRPGMFRKMSIGNALILLCVVGLVIAVAWNKIYYYFIQNLSLSNLDFSNMSDFARMALYGGAALIFIDYIPFGSGLASFATYASAESYSGLYSQYGLDMVWGLSPTYSNFITDAYYPSLAQFGIVGVALFIWFWVYIYRQLKIYLKDDSGKYSINFIIGVLLIGFIMIDSVAASTFTSTYGQIALMILGIMCGKAKRLKTEISVDKEKNTIDTSPQKFVI